MPNTDDVGITKADLELLMKANTDTQNMFGQVLHSFEISTTQIKGLIKAVKEEGETGRDFMVSKTIELSTVLREVRVLSERMIEKCDHCLLLSNNTKTIVDQLSTMPDEVRLLTQNVNKIDRLLIKYTAVIVTASAVLGVLINLLMK